MDEQLEQQIEGRGAEAQIEEVLSQAGEETTEETVPEAGNPEAEVKTESSAEEKVTPNAELSASEDKDNPDGDDSCPPCLKGEANSGATGVHDLPVAGQSRGVTEPQRDGPRSGGGIPVEQQREVSEADRGIPPRNYYAEWQELAEAHPEVVGKELPEDIYQACMQSELPPLRVYESMMLQKQAEQISALQQEIATLRQNAENTARAPVMAAAGGPDSEPEDLFLKGFNSY